MRHYNKSSSLTIHSNPNELLLAYSSDLDTLQGSSELTAFNYTSNTHQPELICSALDGAPIPYELHNTNVCETCLSDTYVYSLCTAAYGDNPVGVSPDPLYNVHEAWLWNQFPHDII